MKKIIFAVIGIMLLNSCSSILITRRQKENYLKERCKDTKIIKDSIMVTDYTTYKVDTIEIPEDSTYLRMWLDCDTKNNISIQQLEEYKGKILNTKVIYKDKILYIQTKFDKQKFLQTFKETVKTKYEQHKNEMTKVYITNKIPKWLWFIFAIIIILVWFRKSIYKLLLLLNKFRKFI